jgi:NTP pyrophosphatase (non-canonical NTP hydrolase)
MSEVPAVKKFADDYQEFTKTTAVYPSETQAQGLSYVTLGLADEVGELVTEFLEGPPLKKRAKIIAEAGDVYWYAARICDHLDIRLSDVCFAEYDGYASLPDAELRAFLYTGIICGRVKKSIRDGHLWNENQRASVERVIFEALRKALSAVNVLARFAEATPLEVMNANKTKLSDRKERGVLQGDGDNR